MDTIEAKIDFLTAALLAHNAGEKIHHIGGYVQGRTSKGDGFILLYSSSPFLVLKVCRVYQESFSRLPADIDTDIPLNAQDGNPDRNRATIMGIFNILDRPFYIVTYQGRDPKGRLETRFSRVLLSADDRIEGVQMPNGSHNEGATVDGQDFTHDAIRQSVQNFLPAAAGLCSRYKDSREVIADLKALGHTGLPGGPENGDLRVTMYRQLCVISDMIESGATGQDAFEAALNLTTVEM